MFIGTIAIGVSSAFYAQIGLSYHFIIGVLFIDVLGGIIAFIILLFFRKKAYSTVRSADQAFLSAFDRLNFLHGYFIAVTEDIEQLEMERLNFFMLYRLFAGFAVRSEQADVYKSISESRLFKELGSELKSAAELGTGVMNMGLVFYRAHEQEFNRHENDFLNLTYVHKSFLQRFNIVYPAPKLKPSSGARV